MAQSKEHRRIHKIMQMSINVVHKSLQKILMHYGASIRDSEITADVLIEGDKYGHPNHGVSRIFQILEGVKKGSLILDVTPELLSEGPSFCVFDGRHGLGQVLGHFGMLRAIEKAQETGVGVVGVINTSHLGVLSYYTKLASKENCIGIACTTSSPAVVIKGGKIKTFGTNPLSYSFPFSPHALTADFATSKVSRGRLVEYAEKNIPISPDWAVDREGKETICAKKALEGGLKTLDGDIKGSLLSFLISVLAGNLLGGVSNHKVAGTRYMDEKPNKGDFFLVIDVKKFTPLNQFQSSLEELVHFIRDQNVDFCVPREKAYQAQLHKRTHMEVSPKLEQLFKYYDKVDACKT